jgi:hypothetical protein
MLAAWARNDYQSILEMRRSFHLAADVLERNAGTVERLELLDEIGNALAESGSAAEADCASHRERLCAYLGLLQHIGASPC